MADQAAHRNAEVSAADRVVASAQVGTSPDAPQYGPSVVARRIRPPADRKQGESG